MLKQDNDQRLVGSTIKSRKRLKGQENKKRKMQRRQKVVIVTNEEGDKVRKALDFDELTKRTGGHQHFNKIFQAIEKIGEKLDTIESRQDKLETQTIVQNQTIAPEPPRQPPPDIHSEHMGMGNKDNDRVGQNPEEEVRPLKIDYTRVEDNNTVEEQIRGLFRRARAHKRVYREQSILDRVMRALPWRIQNQTPYEGNCLETYLQMLEARHNNPLSLAKVEQLIQNFRFYYDEPILDRVGDYVDLVKRFNRRCIYSNKEGKVISLNTLQSQL